MSRSRSIGTVLRWRLAVGTGDCGPLLTVPVFKIRPGYKCPGTIKALNVSNALPYSVVEGASVARAMINEHRFPVDRYESINRRESGVYAR